MAEVTKLSSWPRNEGSSPDAYCSASPAVPEPTPVRDMAAFSMAFRACSSRSRADRSESSGPRPASSSSVPCSSRSAAATLTAHTSSLNAWPVLGIWSITASSQMHSSTSRTRVRAAVVSPVGR